MTHEATLREMAAIRQAVEHGRSGEPWVSQHAAYTRSILAGADALAALREAPDIDLRAEIKRWAIYCFTRHGHDAHLYNGLAKLAGMEPVDYPDANPFAQPFEWTEPVRRGVTIDGDEFVETVRAARIPPKENTNG